MKKLLIPILLLFFGCAFLGITKEDVTEVRKEAIELGILNVEAALIQCILDLAEAETKEEKEGLRDLRRQLAFEIIRINKQAAENVWLREKEE